MPDTMPVPEHVRLRREAIERGRQDLEWLLATGLEVVMVRQKQSMTPGYAVTLESGGYAVSWKAEFDGHPTLEDSLAAARKWAAEEGYEAEQEGQD